MAIDWSTLTDPLQAINLIFKKEDPRDVYQKNNIFQAVVLTPGYTMTQQEAKALQSSFKQAEDDDEESKRDEKKYFARVYFKGRILGPNSPHSFLPNPCDLATAENSDAASRAIALHTTFVSTKDYDKDDMPQPNDIFTVSLRGGDDDTPFNLQIGDALYRTSAPKRRSKKEAEKCETIAEMFQNMSSVSDSDLQAIQAEGTSRAMDDLHPDFRPDVDALMRMLYHAGYPGTISGTYRSEEAQVAAYELGRSEIKEGGSHSTTLDGEPASMAIDIISAEGNGWADTQSAFDFFEKLGEFAVSLGLTWGGDWSPETKTIDGKEYTIGWDPAHVESPLYHGYTNT